MIVLQSAEVDAHLNKKGNISMIRIMYFISVCAAGIALSGCGSSNSSGPGMTMMQDMPDDTAPMPPTGENPSFAERARDAVTGANPPALTSAQIADRARDVTQNAGVLEASRAHYRTDDANHPEFIVESDCSGTSCDFEAVPLDELGLELGFDIDNVEELFALDEAVEPVLTKNGVTILRRRGIDSIDDDTDINGYGAWLEHGVFAVAEETEGGEDIETSLIVSFVGGRPSDSRPSVDATYRGLMVGSPVDGAHRGNTLQGDAELVYTSADNEVDAHFTDIVDLDRGSPHATLRIDFENLAVDEDGVFEKDQSGNSIVGGFVGTDHPEALGIFESDNIVGAFGAIRE